jgi:hypothetical protein
MPPYIVSTRQPCPEEHREPLMQGDGHGWDGTSYHTPPCETCDDRCEVIVSRRAVATLEERQVFDAKQWREAGGDQPDGNEQFWHNALILAKHMERPEAPGPRREELATVLFLHDGRVSHGHFTSMMRPAVSPLPESGGTVTLPDGTVIEVEARKWYRLAQDVGWHPDRDEHRGEDELIAVWNAKQASA